MTTKKYISIVLIAMWAMVSYACTIAVVSGEVTPDGRPILWKNRDVSNPDQEFGYYEDGRYNHVTNIYNGGVNKAWGGVNETGFGIINSDTYNNGLSSQPGPDDGTVMKWALKYCRTVADFEYFLDSTNVTGRRSCHNYGVCDAYGGCAIFETSNNTFVRFDAAADPKGFLVRANFAYVGHAYHAGQDRHDLAMEIMSRHDVIDFQFMFDSVANCIKMPDINPYPLPFNDYESPYPFGYVPTSGTINRYYTSSVEIIIGKRDAYEDREYPVLWGLLGQPMLSLPFPVYPMAHGVHEALDGEGGSEICQYGIELKNFVYDIGSSHYLNTFTAKEILDYHQSPRELIFQRYKTRMRDFAVSPTSVEELRTFQDSLTQAVLDIYDFGERLFIRDDYVREIPHIIEMSSSPNPFNSTVDITLSTCPSNLVITIYDTAGRPIEYIEQPEKNLDGSVFTWKPGSYIPSGVYFINVSSTEYGDFSHRVVYLK